MKNRNEIREVFERVKETPLQKYLNTMDMEIQSRLMKLYPDPSEIKIDTEYFKTIMDISLEYCEDCIYNSLNDSSIEDIELYIECVSTLRSLDKEVVYGCINIDNISNDISRAVAEHYMSKCDAVYDRIIKKLQYSCTTL